MKINPVLFGVLVLVVFLGTVWGFQSAGVWSVSGKVTRDGEAVQPSANDVNTIKGWMTLEQISLVYQVPLADILAQFNLPAGTPASTAIKDLESDTFSAEALREWLVSRAQPAQPSQAEIPTQPSAPTPTSLPIEPTIVPVDVVATPLPTEHVPADRIVSGKTTFQDLLDWGVSEDKIQEIIGGDLPALPSLVKDYVTQKGMPFSEVKSALQVEVDKNK